MWTVCLWGRGTSYICIQSVAGKGRSVVSEGSIVASGKTRRSQERQFIDMKLYGHASIQSPFVRSYKNASIFMRLSLTGIVNEHNDPESLSEVVVSRL